MSKISMRQVYAKILSRQKDRIKGAMASGHDAVRYDFESFISDMMSDDLIVTTPTIKTKWNAMISDRVIQIPDSCQPFTTSVLWIDSLMAATEGRRLVRASLPKADACVCMCVSDSHCHGEEGAQ